MSVPLLVKNSIRLNENSFLYKMRAAFYIDFFFF
jgi:hypothetical protein